MLPPRAYFFIGLNALRALSIVALLLVFASNVVTLVDDVEAFNAFEAAGGNDASSNSTSTIDNDYIEGSSVPNQVAGIFWAVLNRLLILGQTIVLILSEVGWPSVFFDRYFPVLGKNFGLGALGIIQALIGAAILSHHVDDFTLVAAFFLFAVACLNMLFGLIFRQGAKSKRSITSWREHAKGAIPTHVAGVNISQPTSYVTNMFSRSDATHSSSHASEKASLGFGRQAEKAAALKGFLISRPIESLPRYAPGPAP